MAQKTALITGGNGNLGTHVVKAFTDKGYHVIAPIAPGSAPFQDTAIDTPIIDLNDEATVDEFVAGVKARHENIDVLICLVGGFAMGDIEATDRMALQKMFDINFFTAWQIARPVFDQMLTQPDGGRILLIGARAALQPKVGQGMIAYSLSKNLIFHLADLLNAAGKERNIVTSVLVPSVIDTPTNRQSMPDADFNKWVSPEDIAKSMLYLCSEEGRSLREPVLKLYNES